MKSDKRVKNRKEELITDAKLIIDKIRTLGRDKKTEDPLISPAIISKVIKSGILDAPHLFGVRAAKGTIKTMFLDGKNISVDEEGKPISEKDRLNRIQENFEN